MTKLISSLALTTLAMTMAACAHPPPPAKPEVAIGPGNATKPTKVLVLSATCGSVEARCPREYVEAVDAIVRSGLEFDGYALVETRDLLATTRERGETHDAAKDDSTSTTTTTHDGTLTPRVEDTTTTTSHSESETHHVQLDGSIFEDLAVAERQAVLAQVGADAVVSVRLVIGAAGGTWTTSQNVEVMIKLGVDNGDTMAWASRCLSTSGYQTLNEALEAAARCAVAGIPR